MSLEWMAWTMPTAIFFITIACLLVAMTIWQAKAPSGERKGFLPIATTPGDRLFIGLLSNAYNPDNSIGESKSSIWIAFVIALIWMIILMRWG